MCLIKSGTLSVVINIMQEMLNKFNDFVLKSELNGVWRLFNAEQKEYTWSRKKPFTARRVDYILSTDTIFSNVHDCSIHSMAQSDHRLVLKQTL